jgi:hypothetical protein
VQSYLPPELNTAALRLWKPQSVHVPPMQLCRIDQAAGLAIGEADGSLKRHRSESGPREHEAHAASDLFTHGM